ncbi:hypothetical protein [Actinomadura sp. KC06]|uniref:hypothetical protein n=1 Tax=Actinomadura sp. KC06 TaxID=2530369 RepID=UPI001FB81970|nr:hypothetical protein [Actinomadura sp. KC06]
MLPVALVLAAAVMALRSVPNMLPNPEHSITSIAKLLGVSPGHAVQPHPRAA